MSTFADCVSNWKVKYGDLVTNLMVDTLKQSQFTDSKYEKSNKLKVDKTEIEKDLWEVGFPLFVKEIESEKRSIRDKWHQVTLQSDYKSKFGSLPQMNAGDRGLTKAMYGQISPQAQILAQYALTDNIWPPEEGIPPSIFIAEACEFLEVTLANRNDPKHEETFGKMFSSSIMGESLPLYMNFYSGLGEKKKPPVKKSEASSIVEWEAAVQAKLLNTLFRKRK